MAKTLTLELPDDLAARLTARAQALGVDPNHFAVARLEIGLDWDEENDAAAEEELDPELIAALQKGLDEVRAGKTLSMEEVQVKFDIFLSNRFGAAKNE